MCYITPFRLGAFAIVTTPTWVIKVVLSFQRFGFLLGSEHLVEPILAENKDFPLAMVHFVLTQELHYLLAYC